MYPILRNVKTRYKKIISTLGDGINTYFPPFNLKDGEARDTYNTCSDKYPALKVRDELYQYLNPNYSHTSSFFMKNIALIYNEEGGWNHFYINSTSPNVAKGYWTSFTNNLPQTTILDNMTFNYTYEEEIPKWNGTFVMFDTGSVLYTILVNSSSNKGFAYYTTDPASATVVGGLQANNGVACVHKKKLFFVGTNNKLYFSATNVPYDFTTPNDSGSIQFEESITGLISYNNTLVIFTKFGIKLLYGSSVSDFQVVNVEGNITAINHRSIVKGENIVCFIGLNGLYQYNGTIQKLSQKVDSFFTNITDSDTAYFTCIGYHDFRVYCNIIKDGIVKVLVYDTINKIWHIRDGYIDYTSTLGGGTETQCVNQFYKIDYGYNSEGFDLVDRVAEPYNVLFALGTTNVISSTIDNDCYIVFDYLNYKAVSTESIDWYWISKAFNDGGISDQKAIKDLWVVLDLPSGSTLKLYLSTTIEGTDWTEIKEFTASDTDTQSVRVQIPIDTIQSTDWYRLKFVGTGDCTIHYIEKQIRVG